LLRLILPTLELHVILDNQSNLQHNQLRLMGD